MRPNHAENAAAIVRTIADLEQQRAAIRQAAVGRWQTDQEKREIRELTAQLAQAWERRRMVQARQAQPEHELIIISSLKERTA